MRDCHEGAWGEIPAQGSLFCFSCLLPFFFWRGGSGRAAAAVRKSVPFHILREFAVGVRR